MSFPRVNPPGWAILDELTSAQINQLDIDHSKAVDKTGDTFAGGGGISGEVDILSTGSLKLVNGAGTALITISGTTLDAKTGATLQTDAGSTVSLNGTITVPGSSTVSGGMTFTGTTATVDGTSVLSMLNGSILSASTGSTANLASVNIADFQKLRGNVKTLTGNYTVDTGSGNDFLLLCDPTGGTFTITLPAASASNTGRIIIVKNKTSSTNNVAITRTGADTIDGVITVGTGIAYFSVILMCSGSNWYSIGGVGIAA